MTTWIPFRMYGRGLEWRVTGETPSMVLAVRSKDGRIDLQAEVDVHVNGGQLHSAMIFAPEVRGPEFPIGCEYSQAGFCLGARGKYRWVWAEHGIIHTELVRSCIERWTHRRLFRIVPEPSTKPISLSVVPASSEVVELVNQLASAKSEARIDAARRLLSGGAATVAAFCGLFCDFPAGPLSNTAMVELKTLGSDAVPPLVNTLKTGSYKQQVYAIAGLKILADTSALPQLLEALNRPNIDVRLAAINALWILGDQSAVEPLIRLLSEEDINVASAAASTLGSFGDPRAVTPLLRALEDPRWQLRASAAHGLGSFCDEHALNALRRHLRDPHMKVRRSVKFALSQYHDRQRQRQ